MSYHLARSHRTITRTFVRRGGLVGVLEGGLEGVLVGVKGCGVRV